MIHTDVRIPFDDATGAGADVSLPEDARALIIFAHGSGSSRKSPRNAFVAAVLNQHKLGTVLVDLLTASEDDIDRTTAALRFDIGLLAERLTAVTRWARAEPSCRDLPMGYFGASTGAAAALVAAAGEGPGGIFAVVSRGGRPDLAGMSLTAVSAPTLLVVGADDPLVLELNRHALSVLGSRSRLEVVPRATHLFEEPGALERVAELAERWLSGHLPPDARIDGWRSHLRN